MTRKDYKVYKRTSPSGKIYIGLTCQTLEERSGKDGYKYKDNSYLWKAILRYGWNNFKSEILFNNLTFEEACVKEQEMIAYYKSNEREYGYNLTAGGEGCSGYSHTEESKKLMSAKKKNKPLISLQGVPKTEEHKKKLSEAHKGKPSPRKGVKLDQSTKDKISESKKGSIPWNKNKKMSKESCQKMSDSKIGKYTRSNSHNARKVVQLTLDGDFIAIFDCMKDAAELTNTNPSKISMVCNGKRKSTNGFKWMYYSEYIKQKDAA